MQKHLYSDWWATVAAKILGHNRRLSNSHRPTQLNSTQLNKTANRHKMFRNGRRLTDDREISCVQSPIYWCIQTALDERAERAERADAEVEHIDFNESIHTARDERALRSEKSNRARLLERFGDPDQSQSR